MSGRRSPIKSIARRGLIAVAIAAGWGAAAGATVAVPPAPTPAPANALTRPADPAAVPFVPETPRLAARPAPLAQGLGELAAAPSPPSWPALWRGLSWRDLVALAAHDRRLGEIAAVGIGLVGVAMIARRRRRQRLGWGVLPDRGARR